MQIKRGCRLHMDPPHAPAAGIPDFGQDAAVSLKNSY
jgi:hypothetical protein